MQIRVNNTTVNEISHIIMFTPNLSAETMQQEGDDVIISFSVNGVSLLSTFEVYYAHIAILGYDLEILA